MRKTTVVQFTWTPEGKSTKEEHLTLKKLLVVAATAATVSVPLAELAAADPSPSNPGVPGNIRGDSPPGQIISQVLVPQPGSTASVIGPPGQSLNNYTPGQQKK